MRAFTLIEILLTTALAFIVATVASPFYGRFLFAQGLPIAVDELRGSLVKAREYSMIGRGGSEWGVDVSGNEITLFKGGTFSNRDTAFDEIYDIPSRVSLTASNDAVFARVSGVPNDQVTYRFSHDTEEENYFLNMAGILLK